MQIGSVASSSYVSPRTAGSSIGAGQSASNVADDSSAANPSILLSNAMQHLPGYDPATKTVRIDKMKQDAQAQVDAFGKQLRQAAAAAGLDASQPITIREGVRDANGSPTAVVDPSTKDSAGIQALIDNSPTLSLAYHQVQADEQLANTFGAGSGYAQAYGQATTQAQANAVYQQFTAKIHAAETQPVSIQV
jgi:hypothetical protein